jgi:hypothetical protein
MTSIAENELRDRLTLLENEVKNLKEKNLEFGRSKKEKKEKKDKKPRAPTEYNKFMSSFISEQKEKLGDKFQHKMAFSEAARQWSDKKEKDKEKNN